jgi:flagellar motor switch protein FliG
VIAVETLTGTQKVAVALMRMSRQAATAVLQQFSEEETTEITAEIVRLRRVEPTVADGVMDEFYEMVVSGKKTAVGGLGFAATLLKDAFGSTKAAGMMDRLESSLGGRAFEFLDDAEPGQIVALLDMELPQTIALVLAHLKTKKSSAVMTMLADSVRADVAQAIAVMGQPTPEAVSIAADILRTRTASTSGGGERTDVAGGIQPLVEIINHADAATERALMDSLDARDPELAEEIRSRMLTFNDLVKIDRRDVQQILRGIDVSVLALAMKRASPAVLDVIRSNVSERNREVLESAIEHLGPVRTSQIDEARASIVRQIREMEAQGLIEVSRIDEDDLPY